MISPLTIGQRVTWIDDRTQRHTSGTIAVAPTKRTRTTQRTERPEPILYAIVREDLPDGTPAPDSAQAKAIRVDQIIDRGPPV
jgi:hypothetical protein